MSNHRLINALLRKPVDRTPVWIMRQAGRYLPEYQATRKLAGSFLDLCKNPTLATEVTLQPLKRYPQLDAAILFSDILTIPDAMGLGLQFNEGEGPTFDRPISHKQDIQKLPTLDIANDLSYVLDTVELIRHKLNNQLPLIGFSGSPWTLATYMVEGRGKTSFKKVKELLYDDPNSLHLLLDKLTDCTINYLNEQIERGAQIVQIFDTWGGILSTQAYHDFSLFYMDKIVKNLHKNRQNEVVPSILFTKGGGQWLNDMVETGADALGIDWTVDIKAAKKQVGSKVALQGNMDPCILSYSKEAIEQESSRIISEYQSTGSTSGLIFNLGHGITPDIKPENVSYLIDNIANSK